MGLNTEVITLDEIPTPLSFIDGSDTETYYSVYYRWYPGSSVFKWLGDIVPPQGWTLEEYIEKHYESAKARLESGTEFRVVKTTIHRETVRQGIAHSGPSFP